MTQTPPVDSRRTLGHKSPQSSGAPQTAPAKTRTINIPWPGHTSADEDAAHERTALLATEQNLRAEIERLEQRNTDLYEDVQRFKEHATNEKDARTALENEIEALRKDAEWQPIETAPKDEWIYAGRWVDDIARRWVGAKVLWAIDRTWYDWTHWQPLPEAPAKDA